MSNALAQREVVSVDARASLAGVKRSSEPRTSVLRARVDDFDSASSAGDDERHRNGLAAAGARRGGQYAQELAREARSRPRVGLSEGFTSPITTLPPQQNTKPHCWSLLAPNQITSPPRAGLTPLPERGGRSISTS